MVERIGASAGIRSVKGSMFRPSERRIGMSYAMPVQCQVWLRITGSRHGGGPQVSMIASLVLAAIQVRVIHRASPAPVETPVDEMTLTLPLVPASERISRPSRSFQGLPGGSWMSLQIFDHERKPLTEEREIGVCADGIREVGLALVVRVHPAAWLSDRVGGDRPEPQLRLEGELVFVSGILVRLRMRPLVSVSEPAGIDVDIPLTNVGTTLRLAERVVERDVPGLPAILLTFVDAEGRAIGRERLAHASG
jgi:hypothetical protein